MHVEGIIACLAQDTVDYSHFEQLHKMGVPLVFFARCCLEDKFSQVVGNGDVAAQEATQHMIDTGSRRIAFIGGPNHLDMVRRRKHGYLEALRENRIPIDRDLVVCDKIDFDVARNATLRLLEKENRPDAILAFNDIITYAAFDAIKEKGSEYQRMLLSSVLPMVILLPSLRRNSRLSWTRHTNREPLPAIFS